MKKRNKHIFFCFLLESFHFFCYNEATMNDLMQKLYPLTFINTPYTRDTYDMVNYHEHESLELVYIASGSIQMTYFKSKNDLQPKTVAVHENQFMIIRPGVRHIQCVQNQAHMMVLELRHDNSHVPADLFIANSDFVALIPAAKQAIQGLDCVSIFTDIQDVKRIFGKLLSLLYNNQHGKSDEYFSVYYELYLKQLFVEIFKCINTKTDRKYNRYIQYVLSFIQKNYGNEISVAQIAENLDLSPVYLNSIFKKELGISIQEHLISFRIEKAKKLLQEQTQTIGAVAKKVGYKTLRSFELAFVKRTGVSPTAYQAQHKLDGFVLWKNHQDGSIAVDIALFDQEKPKNKA